MTVQDVVEGLQGYLHNDGMADYISMMEGLGLVGQIASLIVGLLVTFIIVGLPVVIAVEVCYINFPIFQQGYENLYGRLKGKANRIFGLVIRDARKAVEDSHTTEYGTSVNWIYLKLKIKSIFICVFIVAMVLGPGQFLIAQAWNLVTGILSSLK